jgi:type IV secretion system protein VirB6
MAQAQGTGTTFLSDAFADVNFALSSFTNTFSAGIAGEIAPLVAGALTLSFIFLGIMAVRGMLDRPFTEVAMKMLKVSVITTLALTTAVYQTYIIDVFLTMPDDIVTGVVANSVSGANLETGQGAAKAIETLYDLGSYNAGLYFDEFSISIMPGTDSNIMPIVYGLMVWIGTLLCCIMGALWLFIAKIVLAVMLGIGPLFIVCLAFQPTQQYFFSWIGAVLNTVITAVIVIAIFAIFSAIFQVQLEALVIDPEANNFAEAATYAFLGLVCMGVLVQVPQYVSQLTAAGGAVGTAMLKIGAGGGAAAAAGGIAAGGVARGSIAAAGAAGKYNQARKGGAGVAGAAKGARHEFNKSKQEMKQGYPDYYRKGSK